ncbi:amidohydrolase [bacterium]|nr:amidohydrolase [bacterium]
MMKQSGCLLRFSLVMLAVTLMSLPLQAQGMDNANTEGTGYTYPGLIDAHAHLAGLGRTLEEVRLFGTESVGEVVEKVRARSETLSQDVWLNGRGWDQNDWPKKEYPTWRDLEGIPQPVYLRRVDGHAAWLNRRALELCGIDAATIDPDGGRIVRDKEGNPTGILIDNAVDLAAAARPKKRAEDVERWLVTAMEECNRLGLTGVHDAGIDSITLAVYKRLADEGRLTLRIYAMLEGAHLNWAMRKMEEGTYQHPSGMLTVRAVKLYADGALGSRGAALLEDYADDPGNRGLLVTPLDTIQMVAEHALRHGFQVCTHAIGDRGNRVTLDAYEAALRNMPVEDHRFRIEHAQVVALSDIPRFAELGIIPSMQPTHATSDMPWAEERLGEDRLEGAYAWQQFLDAGCLLPFGSDFPVERPDPRLGLYAAVTRMDAEGNPEGGWLPDQRVSREQALAGFSRNAAFAAFEEDAWMNGDLGDSTTFDRDLLTCTPQELLEAKVLLTIVNGRVVYDADHSDDGD